MSTILSPIASIDRIQIEPIPTNRLVRVARAVRVGRNIIMVDEDGVIYSTQVEASTCYSFGYELEDTLRGIQRLRLLSKAAVDQHQRLIHERDDRIRRRHAAQAMPRNAEALGLKLTNAQRGRIERALKNDQEA